jgi:hypothetical protein
MTLILMQLYSPHLQATCNSFASNIEQNVVQTHCQKMTKSKDAHFELASSLTFAKFQLIYIYID